MPVEPFRFVHASDLHLEQPVHGLAEVPDHLRTSLSDAPYTAAERVFDCVLAESADFLVLSGDVLNVHYAGPRALVFLLEQFERLASRDVAVYWAGGKEDPPEAWPSGAKLPANVHFFSRHEVEEIIHYRHEEPLCRVTGRSQSGALRPAEFLADENGLFTIAVAFGQPDAEALAQHPIEFWALGGLHERRTPVTAPGTAHYCGSPQGRSPAERGPHGCTLVSVDADRQARTQFVATDVLRWYAERVALTSNVSPDEVRRPLAERMKAIAGDSRDRGALVNWTVAALGPAAEHARSPVGRASFTAELLGWLRDEFGRGESPVWTAALEFEPPAAWPQAWCEEDTILGDFLRAVQVHEADERQPLDLSVYLSASQRTGELAPALELADAGLRRRVLREAAALGVELLRGDAT